MFMDHIAHASKQYQLGDCLVQGLVQTLDKQRQMAYQVRRWTNYHYRLRRYCNR